MQEKTPSALHIFFMLFLVYITWGSTFIGYKLTLEVVGPFFAAGGRSLGGGSCLWLSSCCSATGRVPPAGL